MTVQSTKMESHSSLFIVNAIITLERNKSTLLLNKVVSLQQAYKNPISFTIEHPIGRTLEVVDSHILIA